MRLKYALLVLLFTTPFTIAQEEPLPAVTTRTTVAPEVMLIATAVEPIREFRAPTLAEAALLNDFNSFDTLYREAKQRGEPVAQFETLHQLWTYAMTDPIGSFYGQDMYERLARVYPGYAEFIDQHRIVDSRGNVFYPTSETRGFMLERAMEGTAPRVLLAEDLPGPPKPAPVVATVQPAGGLRARRSTRTELRAVSPAPAVVAPPVVIAPPVVAPAPVERRALSPSAPVAVAETPAETPVAVPAEKGASSRGILLIVIGLLGVGLLAVMFRTPQETLPPIINVMPEEKPAAPVEPLRRTDEPLRRPEGPQPVGKNRATGSHG